MLPRGYTRDQKKIVMGFHNLKDEALIIRQHATKKMNEMGKKLKDENKRSNCRKLFLFAIGSHMFFQSFGVCKSMCVDRAIEKLRRVAREK
jgi:hypothetical protein